MTCELLTGATGFLGSYLLRDALAAGREVAVLVRPDRGATAEQRVATLLARFRAETDAPLATPKVLAGDLKQPGLGLAPDARAWVADHCHRVLHCAASITFRARGGEPYASNVDGTRYVLALCRDAGIRDFHLVSTAYVAGRREGRVMEDELEQGQEFSNDYERSKYVSETLVRSAPFLDRWSVYRPSVIVGDSTTGFSSSRDGLYTFLSILGLVPQGMTADTIFARLGLSPDARLNVVPVNWISATIRHLVERQDTASCTYHLTHPNPVSAAALLAATTEFSGSAPQVPEQALDEVLNVYRPYLREHCEFDQTNTRRDAAPFPCPPMDAALIRRLVHYFASHEFGRVPQQALGVQLALSVVGAEAQTLDLSAPATPRAISTDEADDARASAHCTSDTLARLMDRELTVEQALFGGLVALEGESAYLEQAAGLLQSFVANTSDAPVARMAGNAA